MHRVTQTNANQYKARIQTITNTLTDTLADTLALKSAFQITDSLSATTLNKVELVWSTHEKPTELAL